MRKKTNAKKSEKTAKPVKEIFLKERRLTVAVGKSTDFGKEKVSLGLSENVKEGTDLMELADEMYDSLAEKLEEKFALIKKEDEPDYEDDNGDDPEPDDNEDDADDADDADDEEDDEEDDDEEDEDDITEDGIKKMKKAELIDLIADEKLDIDVKKYKKIGDLRTAVIDELFEDEDEDGEDGEDDEDSWDDDSWDDED